uniref:EF-hand domain-containing protein n=1 Tax=Biomphalaria glabrata TaxID=6526 RepID=A0A2C9JQU0_BIOGL
MVKHLGGIARDKLLEFMNRTWAESRLPGAWKSAVIVPVLKKGKDATNVESYRPISLTSTLGKVAERMEFVMGLSVLSRGTFQERLQWAFSLYDVNGDGVITKEEMLDIVTAIYEMMGRYTEPSIDDTTAREHVERVFQKMDTNRDGVISVEEFMDTCRRDENITRGMSIFDTVL